MNREIKFRAWDKKHKQYVKVLKIYFGANGHILGAQVEDYDTNFAFELQAAQFVLELSTGLKDKNGKEIYEGDLLALWIDHCRQDALYVVKDLRELFSEFEHDDPYYRFTDCEIVGNIHENPELLEDEK